MKTALLLSVMFCLPLLTFGQQTQVPGPGSEHPYAYEMKAYEKILEHGEKGAGEEYDLKYHRFEWYVDPDTCYIEGSVTSWFVPVVAPFSHARFELSSLLLVDSVRYDGASVPFSHAADVLDVNLGATLPLGVLDSLEVFYHGSPGAGMGFGSFIQDTHNSVPVIWTLSEPYGTKDWWPCKNLLSDKIDSIDVIVTTPSAYRVASNGILVSETISGPNKIFHWKHRYPIAAYLVAIAVTNYAVYSDQVPLDGDTLEMLNYVFPEDLAAFQYGTNLQIDVLQFFDSIFGEYPYMNEKYGHAQFKWGGGMEHQTMSFVVNAGYDLLAHEMAHQWYGDKVTCASWQDIWVNEGFATYCQGLTLDFLQPYWFPYWLNDRINSITSLPDGSVFCYDTSSVSRVFDWRLSYQKGAMALHMLRWIMGEDDFFQAMRNILADPQLAYGYAFTEDIQAHFELTSGMNLDGFFDDWIYNEGHPVYTLNCLTYPDSSVQVTLNQTPTHISVSFFELPVPIRFRNATQDTILVFNNTFSGQTFTAQLGFMPDSVDFDPERWLLAVLDTSYVSVGLAESAPLALLIQPNPAQDQIIFNATESACWQITDLSGRVVMQTDAPAGTVRIDVSQLNAGTYFVKKAGGHTKPAGRFVKR